MGHVKHIHIASEGISGVAVEGNKVKALQTAVYQKIHIAVFRGGAFGDGAEENRAPHIVLAEDGTEGVGYTVNGGNAPVGLPSRKSVSCL